MTDARYWWNGMTKELSERFLPRHSATRAGQIAKEGGVVIVPVGATEQHGPHLPLFTDAIIVQSLLVGALRRLPPDHPFYFLYPIALSYSMEHIGFSGTVALSADTTLRVLMEVGESLSRCGFKKVVFLNGHGGNVGLMHVAAREIRMRTGLWVFVIHAGALHEGIILNERESLYGIHAGAHETSLVMALMPEWVDMENIVSEYPEFLPHLKELTLEGAVAFAWKTSDLTTSGVIGDASHATCELGKRLYNAMVTKLTSVLSEIANFAPRSVSE
ncbi:creatininase [Alicyclobacillus cellulosilyticus]|uniref:Creatininase n=1 Tax=Alicyclobacillus cellulosilyticus TaxID=1003997 RepID=A0A917KGG1_9BACL|nr:creatininase family protein [Alicyclobacillus cellulosilyticus]GGJ12765.1 creatininase [Alicyclobacillus cellulosilyticus]